MADGTGMTIASEDAAACLSLEAAIAELEAGAAEAGLSVDLGSGQIAKLEPGDRAADFLARLKAHKALLALAEGGAAGADAPDRALMVDSHAKALLDAVKKAR